MKNLFTALSKSPLAKSTLVAATFGTMALTALSQAQGTADIYNPTRLAKDQRITVKAWGSGTASETDEVSFEGGHSIRVSTRNLFQGAILGFGSPINLEQKFADKNNLLRLTYRLADGGSFNGGTRRGPTGGGTGLPGGKGTGTPGGGARRGGGGPPGAGGGFPGGGFPGGGLQGGGFPGGGFPGGGISGGGFPGGGRGGAGGAGGPAVLAGIKVIRLIVSTSDGLKSEAYIPVQTSVSTGEAAWRSVSVPLQAITGFDRTNKIVSAIAISGDATSTFYVGDLKVVNDSTPIRGDTTVHTLNLALGDEVILSANASGGSSILKYTWDFDDKDGIQIDAEGRTIRRKFRKPGTYTITLTVSDYYGLKPSYSTTISARVNP